MRFQKLTFFIACFVATSAYGGWWSNYEDESWCHRVGDYKYCLPETFKVRRIDDAQLSFIDRSDEFITVFGKFLGKDTAEEFLADPQVPKELIFESDTQVNELRLIRYAPNKAEPLNHDLMVAYIVFPDLSIVQIFGHVSTQTENAINVFIQPIPVR